MLRFREPDQVDLRSPATKSNITGGSPSLTSTILLAGSVRVEGALVGKGETGAGAAFGDHL